MLTTTGVSYSHVEDILSWHGERKRFGLVNAFQNLFAVVSLRDAKVSRQRKSIKKDQKNG